MKFRFKSKFLILAVLLNSILPKSSFASSERYEYFEGRNLSITDILEEQEADMQLEGNTMVNLLDTSKLPMKFVNYSTVDDKYAFFREVYSKQTLKANKVYTAYVKYRIDSYSQLSTEYNRTRILPKCTYVDGEESYPSYFALRRATGTYSEIVKFIPPKDTATFELGWAVRNATVSGEMLEAVLLEGDYTNEKITYFEGLKSLGQNSTNTLELILGRGNPNILKGSDWTLTATKDKEAKPETVSYGIDSSINLQDLVGKKLTFSFFVHTKGDSVNNPNRPIYGSENSRFGIHMTSRWSDSTGVKTTQSVGYPFAGNLVNNNVSNKIVFEVGTLNPPSGYDTLDSLTFATQAYRLPALNNNETWIMSRPKLEFGSSNTNWLPTLAEDTKGEYHQKINFKLEEPLRSLPNGVKDRIIKKDGRWVIERNTKEIILDDSFDWKIRTSGTSQDMFYTNISDMIIGLNGNVTVQSDTYRAYDSHEHWFLENDKGIANGQSNIDVRIKDNRFNTVEQFKAHLKNNPVTLVYQLQKPVYTTLDIKEIPFLYKDVTNIYTNGDVLANIKINVDRAANRAKDAIESAKKNPSVENLANARYWSNLLKDSLLKDEFQTSLDEINSVEDLQIDKKTITSNADVYILTKNTLSLSLDTNSITFEDFNSTQDLEMKNAVNLTVSSSLPYKINAYLASEIYNNDKSKVLDKSILNIKTSGDTSYKAFKNTSEPILLLDNQEKCDEVSHSVDFILKGGLTHKADVYKTTIKFEVLQK